ncbi:LPS assembly lipoprotein LptE [Candidatus Nitrospira allomarina]|uniref:LPS assembly lipoprotein LptE n=1 Tax=Candidatus Nitrospira allomarina TaxID=3020900 RepID=A0AA96JT83_9BACT|nr:LPS assembly lipoprotein LptE [Candidatus Nitrospira allomarina]WNM59322.1 LPS assembly lipoprotein LptE [Candidatus Nitrospira allomarina]
MTGWGVWLCLIAGCGYQFTVEGPGPVIGGSAGHVAQGPPIRMVFPVLKNNSFEPNLEFKYTRYFRQAFQSVGSAEFVDDGSADFVMEGAILSVGLSSLAFTRTQTQESRVMVKVLLKVKDRKTGKVRWSQIGTSTAEFFVGATSTSDAETGLQFNRVLQDRAVEQAGQQVAADLADQFLGAREQGVFDRNRKETIPDPESGGGESPEISAPYGDLITPGSQMP